METAVAPANLATEDSIYGAGTLTGVSRIQLAYGGEHFSHSGMIITELRFRPDYYYGRAFATTVEQIQIRLSTTDRDPENLSRNFAENVGADETVVFDGTLTISSAFTGPLNGPKDFDIVFPLSQVFVYGPAAGALLVDIRNFSGSGASPLSGQGRSDDAASRVIGGIYATAGTWDRAVDALQVVYIPTNGPVVLPRVIRGPYLQSGTTSNVVVRWRTSRATDSRVLFGLSEGALTWSIDDPEAVMDHAITLTNLAADTQYFYAIGISDALLAGGADYHIYTAPATNRAIRIWALSDYGTTGNNYGLPENAAGVRDSYVAYAGGRPTDVWLTMGDNSQTDGLDSAYQSQVFNVYPHLLRRMVIWPSIGNHDAAYYPLNFYYTNIFSPPTEGQAGGVPSHTRHYYSFDCANVHFVCLDSITAAPRLNTAMLEWLEADLSANTQDWLIAYWHCPPYTFGTHDSDNPADTWGAMVDMREVVLPILEAHGVDLVLSGHSHQYERSYLLDGHYGYSSSFQPEMIQDSGSGQPSDTGAYRKAGLGPHPHQGAVYVVAAVGGWVTPLIPGLPALHPAMHVRIRERGSMVIDVNGNQLDAAFLRETGEIADHFSIVKGAEPEDFKVAASRFSSQKVRLQWKSQAGARYRVEQSTTLGALDWLPVSEVITARGATTGWTNSLPGGDPACFYRVKRQE